MIAHYAAVKARLQADTIIAPKVFDAARVDATGALIRDTYVILFGGPPDDLDDGRNTSPQSSGSDAVYLYPTKVVSITAIGALGFAKKVSDHLVGFRPVIANRLCGEIALDDADPVEVDFSVTPPLYYVNQDFILKSSRA